MWDEKLEQWQPQGQDMTQLDHASLQQQQQHRRPGSIGTAPTGIAHPAAGTHLSLRVDTEETYMTVSEVDSRLTGIKASLEELNQESVCDYGSGDYDCATTIADSAVLYDVAGATTGATIDPFDDVGPYDLAVDSLAAVEPPVYGLAAPRRAPVSGDGAAGTVNRAVDQPVYDISTAAGHARRWPNGAGVDVGTDGDRPSPTYEVAAPVAVNMVTDQPVYDISTPAGHARRWPDGAGVDVGTDGDRPSPTYEVAAATTLTLDILNDATYESACA